MKSTRPNAPRALLLTLLVTCATSGCALNSARTQPPLAPLLLAPVRIGPPSKAAMIPASQLSEPWLTQASEWSDAVDKSLQPLPPK